MSSRPTDRVWFRSLHYGFADPGCTICLWWWIWPDRRLHVRSELRAQGHTIEQLAQSIRRRTRELGAVRYEDRREQSLIKYTVADEANIGKVDDDGESRAETFSKCGVPLRVIAPDPVQGWTRVHELLGVRPDGRPWLTIDPSCTYLLKALPVAVQDDDNPDDMRPFAADQPLRALRIGAMSRPAPKYQERPELPPNAIGRVIDKLRLPSQQTSRWR